ncbi:MAG: MFS transporter [Candidatus Heimdallarchaeota archaeon]|nr:MFS transporter [Candidatus Heimdallarchaeota archaeon]MDH5645441.1 MFS transporter [Candidatus Heimdallarchaeota archaeon]
MYKNNHKKELIWLYLSTFLLRTGFGGSIILFDWTLVWAIENSLGGDQIASSFSILLISISAITYYIAEIIMTGYYGKKSDKTGAKPVIMYATFGSALVLILYFPASLIFASTYTVGVVFSLILLTIYLAVIHFVHGIFASAKVAPSLGFINKYSDDSNRSLHMAWYDNAILYGRAAGILFGGFLWIILKVDHTSSLSMQSVAIAKTYPILSILLLLALAMIYFGLSSIEGNNEEIHYSIKEDTRIALNIMLQPERKKLLLPWISIAALLGSASLWGPTVSFILSEDAGEHRGYEALLPILIILIALALPAPLWGVYADRNGNVKTLKLGLLGMPIFGILGLLIGYPYFHDDISIGNINLLLSLVPAALFFSALIPVLMSALGDTAEETHGEVMSGYHFIIATGEIIGILGGGIVIGLFSIIQNLTGIFGVGSDGYKLSILIGFGFFEILLVFGMIFGILKLQEGK